MTWSNFVYLFLHAARDAGAAAITANNAFHADYPKDLLIDDRAGTPCKFAASDNDHYIDVDRGSGSLDAVTRIVIPAGHNMSGATFDLDADDVDTFDSPATSLVSGQAITSAMINKYFSSNDQRYLRFTINGTGQWEIPELVYTVARSPDRGPEKGWADYFQYNTQHYPKESGAEASLALGADRRYFGLDYRDVKLTADLEVFEELLATCGTSRPFFILPAWESSDVLWVKLTEDSVQTQDEAVPAATDAPMKHIRISMLEHLA